MFGLGWPELIVVFLVILLLFGAKAIPDIAKGLGQAIRVLRKEKKTFEEDLKAERDTGPNASRDGDKNGPAKA